MTGRDEIFSAVGPEQGSEADLATADLAEIEANEAALRLATSGAMHGMIAETYRNASRSAESLSVDLLQLIALTQGASFWLILPAALNGDAIVQTLTRLLDTAKRLPQSTPGKAPGSEYVGTKCQQTGCTKRIIRTTPGTSGRPIVSCAAGHNSYVTPDDANEATTRTATAIRREEENRARRPRKQKRQ